MELGETSQFMGFLSSDDERWSACLERTAHDFFHLPAYVSVAAPQEGGDPLLFLLDQGDRGMMVPVIRKSLARFGDEFRGFWDVASPYGYPCPLYWGEAWRDHLADMHEAFHAFLREQNVVSLFVRLSPFLGAEDALLAPLGEVVNHGPMVFIDLKDEKASWTGMNRGNREFIRRMLQRGHQVRIDDWDSADEVIRGYHETMERLEASSYYFFPRDYFWKLRDQAGDHFHLATAFDPSGSVMGGCFFTEVGGLIQYFLMGTLESHRAASPSKLVINGLRLWGLEHGHHTLNLGGGVGARKDGLFDFKVRLSRTSTSFSTFRKILLPEVYEDLVRKEGHAESASCFFPLYRWEGTSPTPVSGDHLPE